MAEYIKQKIQGGKKSICDSCTHRNVCKAIDNQPCTECNHYQCTADVEPVQEWIPVKDGLPECEGSYIVYTERGSIYASHFYTEKRFASGYVREAQWSKRGTAKVTHWMHLPQPPKGE